MIKTILQILLLFIPTVIYSQLNENKTLLEITIEDSVVISDWMPTDTIDGDEDYDLNEKRYFIRWNYRKMYDTIIVYYDDLKQDTFMISIYNGIKDTFFKEFYRSGELKTIESTSKNINKSWYENGELRWDKVPNSNFPYLEYRLNIKNKSWFPDGSLRSDTKKIDSISYVTTIYFDNSLPRHKSYYKVGTKTKGDGYSAPKEYYDYYFYKEEAFCENGQLLFSNEVDRLIENYKTYYCDGTIKSRSDYYVPYFSIYGKCETYYPNGSIQNTGEFTAFDNTDNGISQAYMTGKWVFYDKSGNIVRTEIYDDKGKLKKKY